jgi:hypothetical protein
MSLIILKLKLILCQVTALRTCYIKKMNKIGINYLITEAKE